MNTVSKSIVALIVLMVVISIPFSVFAQPGFDPGITDGAPLDGGLSMLVIAGVVYGANKINKKRNEKNAEQDELSEK